MISKLLIIVTMLCLTSPVFAVELLIKRQANYIHGDSIEDRSGIYQRGDIVVAMPDGHVWGKEEHPLTTTYRPPRFLIVKITGISVARAREYLNPETEGTGDNVVRKTRRLFRFLVENIPQSYKDEIATTGEITVTFQQVRNFIQNKRTGVTE